ncbi:MAG: putative CXXCH cytochrome family protein [Rhodothermales bacterium]|jgi:predicted CXXCH cytochrome family protein
MVRKRRQKAKMTPRSRLLLGVLAPPALIAIGWLAMRQQQRPAEPSKQVATYVGASKCAACHEEEHELWAGSHHHDAMAVATEETVLGDFDDAVFESQGITSRFFKRDGKFFVNTEGPDGKPADFEVAYTFGLDPLQQYLIPFPGGRLQCLTVAWDTHREQWYSLYPDQKIHHSDWLHWTRGAQNWNTMCADCHSTNLQKNYDPEKHEFNTTWSEINVSCEACHGPGSQHVEWAESGALGRMLVKEAGDGQYGLATKLKDVDSKLLAERCAHCHSRRGQISSFHDHTGELLDHYVTETLRDGLYHADGQILDEVYVYGSFRQSKMYHKGVRCTDCHEPHSIRLRATGNDLCVRCHDPTKFNTEAHHHHPQESAGAECVNCHMPGRTYMGVDFRRDHSFRLPRPDLTVIGGTPNACNDCHADKGAQWAADAIVDWFGTDRPPHFSETLIAAHTGAPGAAPKLSRLATDAAAPAIARATAALLLREHITQETAPALLGCLEDDDPLVRYTALGGLMDLANLSREPGAPPANPSIMEAVDEMLDDPVRSVRTEAANVLATLRPHLPEGRRTRLDKVLREYQENLLNSADFPGGQMNLGILRGRLGDTAGSERAYREAIALDPFLVQPRMNLATILNGSGRNADAERELRKVVELEPQFGEAYYSLGLLLAEEKRLIESEAMLRKAAALSPSRHRIVYNWGLALMHMDRLVEAAGALAKAVALTPQQPDYLHALALVYSRQGNHQAAIQTAQRLVALYPNAPATQQLLRHVQEAGQR